MPGRYQGRCSETPSPDYSPGDDILKDEKTEAANI
jgi:hypothetical protein